MSSPGNVPSYAPPVPPQPGRSRTGVVVAALIAAVLVLALVTVVALGRFGSGPFAHKVPKVPAPTEWPATAGELRLAGNSKPDVDEIGAGYCGSSILGRFLTRQCGVARGSIVAVVESPPIGPSDEELIRYAASLADALT